jgi:hypothetical protein
MLFVLHNVAHRNHILGTSLSLSLSLSLLPHILEDILRRECETDNQSTVSFTEGGKPIERPDHATLSYLLCPGIREFIALKRCHVTNSNVR